MKKLMMKTLLTVLCVTPFLNAEAVVTKKDRALVVMSELDTRGMPELAPLYRALEELTQHAVMGLLGDRYERIEIIPNARATAAELKQTLFSVARDSEVKAIDVILSLHGLPGKLAFSEGTYKTSSIENFLLTANTTEERVAKILMKKKLRLMYNLSCYGASHNQNFINVGFKTSIGSIGVNANSEVEFGPVLLGWRNGESVSQAFSGVNNDIAIAAADAPIKALGELQQNALRETNSKKKFMGDTGLKINSDAQ